MSSINVKMEKANAILRFHRLQTITTLFRFLEMFVFLIVISRFSSQLPFSVRLISADHFRGISFAIFSPRFVFVIGNVIVLILLFKSRVVENGDRQVKIDVYDEYIRRCEKNVVNTKAIIAIKDRKICRSQSENLMIVECKDNSTHRKLRRSVTERKVTKKLDRGGGETAAQEKSCAAEDEMSSEEFRRTVEAFITRQQQSLRDEELSPITYIGA